MAEEDAECATQTQPGLLWHAATLAFTLDDLRPQVRANLEHLAEMEGATIGNVYPLRLDMTWARALFDEAAWESPPGKSATGHKHRALQHQFQERWKLWHSAPAPRPKLTAEWLLDELALEALAGGKASPFKVRPRGRPTPRAAFTTTCEQCGATFTAKRRHARLCSPRCRQRTRRGRRKDT